MRQARVVPASVMPAPPLLSAWSEVATLQLPRKGFLVAEKVQPLIRLVSAGHIKASSVAGAFFLGEQKRSVCCTQQPISAGDHIKLIVRLLLSGVMDKKQTDAIAIRQRLQPSDDLIVVGIAIVVPADFPHLLKGVNDDKGGVRMLSQKIGKLLIQTAAKLTGRNRKE